MRKLLLLVPMLLLAGCVKDAPPADPDPTPPPVDTLTPPKDTLTPPKDTLTPPKLPRPRKPRDTIL